MEYVVLPAYEPAPVISDILADRAVIALWRARVSVDIALPLAVASAAIAKARADASAAIRAATEPVKLDVPSTKSMREPRVLWS